MKKWLAPSLAIGLGLLLADTASAQIKMGVAGPITGGSAAFGAQLRNGVEQAVEDINAAGGILGQKITISVGDDRADPKEGVSVANKFVGDGVKFVIGHFNSGVTMPASEVYQENGVLQVTPASTNPRVTERGMWNIFRTCGRDDQQGSVAGAYIVKAMKGKMKEVLFEGVNKDDKDFSALVSKIKASGADLVYWGGLHDTGGLILRQMRDQGIKAPMMGGDGITDEEFAAIAGPGAEGTLMTYGPDPRKRPEAKDVVEKFRKKNFEPQAYTLYSYASVQVLKQAAEQAKSLDPKRIAAVMHSGKKFNTVIGELSFDKKGDVTRLDYVMYVWKKNPDGKITYVELE